MIVELDREKLAETFEEAIDPNLLYEEAGDDVDHDELVHQHHHIHHVLLN